MRSSARSNFVALLLGCLASVTGQTERLMTAAENEPVTFACDVAPIVYQGCASCHQPNGGAPFSLLTYDDVKRRASQIVEVTQRRFMPPWLPSQGEEHFVGARRLSDRELAILKQWADSGTPRGDDSDLPRAPAVVDGWQLGQPDLVLESPPYTLAGDQRDVFRNFVIPLSLDSPRWVEAIELHPDNPRVTHHARLGIDSTHESVRRDAEDDEPGYPGMAWGQDPQGQLVIWAPGMIATPGETGVAWRLSPNTSLVLHTHLQPSGKPETTKFRVGLHFAKQAPSQFPVILRIGSCDIDIPAGAKRHVVSGQYVLPIDVDVHTIFPHAHSLCRSVHATAELPDGSSQNLISIERFDENWHDSYRFRKPLRLPRGTRLHTSFVYDNTDANIRNRNRPPRRVVYGSGAGDEMGDIYLQVTAVHPDRRAALIEDYKRYDLQSKLVGYQRTLDLYSDDPWAKEALAACYLGLGKPRDAITILTERLKTGSAQVYPVVSLAMALFAAGDPVAAEARAREAVSLDDQYPLAWLALGDALAAQNKTEAAVAACRQAIDRAPLLIDARLKLADLLVGRGQFDEAAQICSAALTSGAPDLANIHLKLAEICAKQNKYDESLQHADAARRLAPYTHPPKILLAVYLIQSGDEDKGLTLLREVCTEEPSYPVAPLMLGQMARRRQQPEVAKQHFAEADSLVLPENWPDSHKRRFQISLQSERLQLAQQLQDFDLALDALSRWLQLEPDNLKLQQLHEQLQKAKSQ